MNGAQGSDSELLFPTLQLGLQTKALHWVHTHAYQKVTVLWHWWRRLPRCPLLNLSCRWPFWL